LLEREELVLGVDVAQYSETEQWALTLSCAAVIVYGFIES